MHNLVIHRRAQHRRKHRSANAVVLEGGARSRLRDEPFGLSVEVRPDPLLGLDIDTPADLTHPWVQEVLPSWMQMNRANPV